MLINATIRHCLESSRAGLTAKLRERSAETLLPIDFPGYAVGGLSVGEAPPQMYETLEFTVPILPEGQAKIFDGGGDSDGPDRRRFTRH